MYKKFYAATYETGGNKIRRGAKNLFVMKKVLFTATVARHINAFHIPFLRMFQEKGYETCVAANFKGFEKKLEHCNVQYDVPFERNPFNLQNFQAYKQLREIINNNEFEIIHCHIPVSGVLTRIASRRCRKKGASKIIYTAHGFHFYKGAPLINWLLYFPAEWICSFFTDVLITINKEDYEFAKKHLHAKKTEYIPGVGIDLEKFSHKISDEEKQRIRAELGLMPEDKLLLSVGELIKRKNHVMVLKALVNTDKYWKYYICGRGVLKDYLQKRIGELGLNDRVKLLGFRTDIDKLCACADLFVFPSLQEGLPVALMEAIACKTPVLCSKIRGNNDLVTEENMFDLNDVGGLAKAITDGVSQNTVEANYNNLQKFNAVNVCNEMRKIYGFQQQGD